MSQQQYKVVFQPQGRTVFVLAGTKIIEAAATAGIIIDTPCGGAGNCGKCRVKIIQPTGEAKDSLACQTGIFDNLTIEVPQEALLSNINKISISSDLPQIAFEDDKPLTGLGVAVDIGTTTVVASLLDLTSRAELAVVSDMNPQIVRGDDVVTRIKFASYYSGLTELQKTIADCINGMIEKLCIQARTEKSKITRIAVAGNTVMEHLFGGIDPYALGQMPFEPQYYAGDSRGAAELNIKNISAEVYSMPVIGGFVGGDISAGLLATDILSYPQPLLFIDIGTNGEIVIVNDNKIYAASTAAGPAFEGVGISQGSRAMSGAIEKIKFEDDCLIGVIGNVPAVSICGSGIVDLTAELLNVGIVDITGRMAVPEKLPAALADRIVMDAKNSPEFMLTENVKFTQKDVRSVQLAVGAVKAGINIMLKKAGITAGDLQKVFVAGGFGNFIRRNNAQRIGLLPAGVSHEKITFIGNSSLAGAKLAVLSDRARKRAEELVARAEHIVVAML